MHAVCIDLVGANLHAQQTVFYFSDPESDFFSMLEEMRFVFLLLSYRHVPHDGALMT